MNLKSVSDIQHFGCVVAEKVLNIFLTSYSLIKKYFQHSYIASTVKQNSSGLGVAIV